MPAQKRALADADVNAQPKKKRNSTDGKDAKKHQDKDDSSEGEDRPETPDDDVTKKPPYSYICINRPYYAGAEDNFQTENVDTTDEDEDEYKDGGELFNKPASEHPDWQYKIMVSSWIKLCDQIHQSSYTNPDNFGMLVYTDTHGYGVMQILENILIAYDKAYKSEDLDQMWSIVAMLGHWLNHDAGEPWYNHDDGEGIEKAGSVLGALLLTTLEKIDGEGELKQDSKYLDLGLVMALHLKYSNFPAEVPIEEVAKWRPYLVGYAKKADIDLLAQGVADLGRYLNGSMDLPTVDEIQAIEGSADEDRWSYEEKFKDLAPTGGDSGNILKWSRQARKEASYENKDPLQHIPVKDLRDAAEGKADLVIE